MQEGLYKARIVSVTTSEVGGRNADSILVNFEFQGKKLDKPFDSPFLSTENMHTWRAICVFAIEGRKADPESMVCTDFGTYQSALGGAEVFVGYDGERIFAIGKKHDNLFFPDAYRLWGARR